MPFTICRSLTSIINIVIVLRRRGLWGGLGAACKVKCRSLLNAVHKIAVNAVHKRNGLPVVIPLAEGVVEG